MASLASARRLLGRPVGALDSLGEQLLFYIKALAWTPRTIRRYKKEVLRLLARRGYAIPDEVLGRDVAQRHEPSPAVEAAWADIYAGDGPEDLVRLGEVLTDVAELVWRWRNDHLVATRRAMGAKPGTGGSAGVAWLEKRAQTYVFPELWTARSYV